MSRWVALSALLVLLTAGGSAGIRIASPFAILRRALAAPQAVDYEGIKVLVAHRGRGLESITLLEMHRRPHAYRMEYLSPPGIAGRILVDTGQESWHYEPSAHLAVRGPTLGPRRLQALEALPEHYRLRLLGTTWVAGRPTYLLELVPTGQGVHRRFWIDQQTALILAWQESDPDRGVFFASAFTRFSVARDLPEALFRFQPPARARVVEFRSEEVRPVRLSELAKQAGFRPVAPAEAPAGFRYRGGGISRLGGLRAAVLLYGDGASTVSLFQLPARYMHVPPGGVPLRIGKQHGRLYPYGAFRVLVWERAGLRFAAVGSVPTATLLAFAQGTDPSGEADRIVSLHRATGVLPDRIEDLRDRGATFSEIRALLGAVAPSSAGAALPRPEFLEVLEGFHEQVRFELTRR